MGFLPEFLQARPSERQIKIHCRVTPASVHASMPAYNTCACVFWCYWMIQRCSMTDDCCCTASSGARRSSPPCSVPISPVLLQMGHSFPARKSPISPDAPCQAAECRPQASWTGLSSPKACVAQRIDFFPSHFISFISCGFMSNCELDKKS